MSSSITTETRGNIEILKIQNTSCTAEISLFGGHVLTWQPKGHAPVFWMSHTSCYDGKTALRGGIPFCWPWFGPAENKGRHGLVRNRNWALIDTIEEPNKTTLKMQVEINEEAGKWHHPRQITQEITVGDIYSQECRVTNDSECDVTFAFALHNYFSVSHPRNIRIPCLFGCKYDDKISQEKSVSNKTGSKEAINYAGPIDRIYHSAENAEIFDEELNRVIRIQKYGSNQWVLWNPGDGATDISDIHKGGEEQYMCLEAANTDDIVLKPGENFQFGQSIALTKN